MVFLAMLVLGWMWGVAGLLLAVPLLTCAKIIAERIEGGEVLSRCCHAETRSQQRRSRRAAQGISRGNRALITGMSLSEVRGNSLPALGNRRESNSNFRLSVLLLLAVLL